jgi:hypothetical protein
VGRESQSIELFAKFSGYLAQQKEAGLVESFEPAVLMPHGGDLNGFILIRGERDKLDQLRNSDEFFSFRVSAEIIMHGLGILPARIGEGVMKYMAEVQKQSVV